MTDATSRTLRNELWRSLPSGVIDTLTATFGMLIAVRVFHMGDAAKSLFLSATSGGMVASLFVVPLLLRAKSTLPRTAAKVQMLGGACGLGYVTAADGGVVGPIGADDFEIEIAGVRYPATASLKPMYDPTNARIKI